MPATKRWVRACAVIFTAVFLAGAAASEPEAGHGDHASGPQLAEKPARLSSRDVKIPKGLTREIEEDYRAFLTQQQVPSKEAIKRRLFNVSVELVQKHPGPLVEDVRITAPLGGGVVDLSEFVTPLRGSFHVKFVVKKEGGAEPEDLHVFFVSKAKQRKIGEENYGAGCNKYMDITSYFASKMHGKGFEVYTADQRYLSVLGGTFVLVGFEKDALFVGSLTFTDPRYANLVCE